ncbi:flagellar motor switch protein FliN [Mesorhizobium sp. IMUNJ 23232]|uniref:flagellar motor switch protein FliN n=1 Tax=Mesorhizobium sp. IMUNJ 23232 TaxID=3376064 RepID=UPI0037B3A051
MSHGIGATAEEGGEDQLNRAIEELRGVLSEGGGGVRAPSGAVAANANIIMNIPVEVQIVLGSAEMSVSELMGLQKGSTVALNRRVGEAVDVMVNGRRIARGEITVLDNDPSRFGLRLTEIITSAGPA